jgi:hypothetical protein
MIEAKSIYLGGAIVTAPECDYHSTIDLGLNCPFCSKPVFLVKAFDRQRGDKAHVVPAHFSHYKADSELGKDCEARSLSKEGREFLQKLRPEARGQRLAVFNRRMWQMLAWQKDIPSFKGAPNQTQEIINHLYEVWPQTRSFMAEFLREQIQTLTPLKVRAQFKFMLPEVAEIVTQTLLEDLDTKMQVEIGIEVAEYLHTPPARPVFDRLIKLAIMDAIDLNAGERPGGVKATLTTNLVHHMALATIALTPWEEALKNFAKPQAGDGFGRR